MEAEKYEEEERDRSLLELAMEISLDSLGSSQTLPLPHLRTLAASRFCSFSDTMASLRNKRRERPAKRETSLYII